ncbi:MAG TPA: hypothetical protein VEQ85_03100 [Lacipirellulaceae bacterium]|nr:hypothetical protein [Lacipirellulaceae bacterium]
MNESMGTNGSAAMAPFPAVRDERSATAAGGGRQAERARAPRSSSRAARSAAGPYDALLWRLQARTGATAEKTITLGFTSCERRAGVTTVAANVATRAAELRMGPVLLVEATGGPSRLAKLWRLSAGPGLAQLLDSEAAFGDCLRPGPAPELTVLPSGVQERDGLGTLEAGAAEALLAEACADHRLVIFDLPAASQLREMLLVARLLDQVLLVVRSESTRRRDAQRLADVLLDDGVPLSGAVLNRQRCYVPRLLQRWI